MKISGLIYKKTFALKRNQYESISLIASLDDADQSLIEQHYDTLKAKVHELQLRPQILKV